MKSRRGLRTFVRWFWGVTIFSVIFLAVLVQLGRFAFPYINHFKSQIESTISERLNATITVGDISGSWDGMRPSLTLTDVRVAASNADEPGELTAKSLSAQINLLDTFRDWRTALRYLDFEGLTLELRQAQDGAWSIAGLPASSADDSQFRIDDPLDIFLFGRRLEVRDISVAFKFRTGHVAQMEIPSVSLENDEEFHRLKARLGVDNDIDALYFVLEGKGDPRDEKNFDARGYLQLQQFPLQKVVAATGLNKGLEIEPGLWSDGSRMDMQFWFEGSLARGLRFNGGAQASGLPVELPGGSDAPAIPPFKYSGFWTRNTGLYAQVSDFALSWPQAEVPPLDFTVSAGLNAPPEIRVRELDISAWSEVVRTLKLSDTITRLQAALNPGGMLRNIGVTLTTPEEGYFRLRAELEGGAVDSWQGAPQVRNAQGFLEANAFSGRMVLDTHENFLMHYPVVYEKPLEFNAASGEAAWFVRPDEQMVYVTSGLLKLSGESGDGAGYLYLSLPMRRLEDKEPEMTLVVGMRQSLAQYHEKFVPFTIPDALYKWLDRSIQEGELRDGGFIYRGSLRKTPLRPRSMQLTMDVLEGELAFDPNWPVLKKANATLLMDDLSLVVAINQGELLNNQLQQGRIELIKTDSGVNALAITATANGQVSDALALLRASPVNEVAGAALDTLNAAGRYQGTVRLQVPFEGGYENGWQDINVDLEDATLQLPDLNLAFESLNGRLNYHSKKGLSANNISAVLWGEPLTADLATQKSTTGQRLAVDFDGTVAMAELQPWLQRPILHYTSGKTRVNGSVTLPFGDPEQGIDIAVTSQLKGVTLNLPKPYAKTPDEPLGLAVSYRAPAQSDISHVDLAFDNGVNAKMLMQAGGLAGLNIAFGQDATVRMGDLRIEGQLGAIDIPEWASFTSEYIDALTASIARDTTKQPDEKRQSLPAPTFSMALRAQQAQLGDIDLQSLAIWGKELEESWYFDIETQRAIAQYQRFNNGAPSSLRFEYLHLPEPTSNNVDENISDIASAEIEAGAINKAGAANKAGAVNKEIPPASLLTEDMLQSLQATDITIDELAVGGKGWGHIAFDYRPGKKDYSANNIRGTLRGIQTSDSALMLYRGERDAWETQFTGQLYAQDIASTLEAFGYPPALVAEKTHFDVNLKWPGFPDQVSPMALSGEVGLNLRDGRFVSEEGKSDSGFLKLIALLNFDTLVRRLKLDFSDLHPEGLSFDKVGGTLNFEPEYIYLRSDSPLTVETTSADIALTGDIDLKHQTVDSHLVATLPVAGNLAVAAALTAGLPAALGVYVVGKLFEEQVDNVANIKYKLTGPWSEPKLSVDKISEVKTEQKSTTPDSKTPKNVSPKKNRHHKTFPRR